MNKKRNVLKSISAFIFLLAIISFGCYFYFEKKMEESKETMKKMVGVWKTNYQSKPNSDGVYANYDLTLSLNEDGSCTHKGSYVVQRGKNYGSTTMDTDYEGKYELNILGNKFRIVVEPRYELEVFYRNYTNFNFEGDTLTIGDFVYNKVSNK